MTLAMNADEDKQPTQSDEDRQGELGNRQNESAEDFSMLDTVVIDASQLPGN